ncbi:MAG TPA: sigma-70 family RNA polymerase sigma factor [Acidimicrobiales bacterium]|nr:sigma-70 family RNA polymerase sigma factor [Acidimicrobiales bacterium]
MSRRGRDVESESERSFVAFVRAVLPALMRLTRRVAPEGVDPEDIASEALGRCFANWDQLQNAPYREAWVMRVAANLAYKAYGRAKRFRSLPARIGPVHVDAPESVVAARTDLGRALRALPQRQREAIALHYLADLPLADISRAMGVSGETVKTHLERGLAALRRELGVDLEGAVNE